MAQIVILFSGRGGNLENLIQKLHGQNGLTVAAALTNNPSAPGIDRAKNLGVETVVVPHANYPSREAFDQALIEAIEPFKPDRVVLAGFMRILTPLFTRRFETINIHPSLLPLFKGTDAIRRSFESGMDHGGVSVHRVNEELDGGEILAQTRVPILPGDTYESFANRVHEAEFELYPHAIRKILASKGS